MRDRRFEPRQELHEAVEVHWADDAGVEQVCAGVLHDVSRSGAGIHMARPVQMRTVVTLKVREIERTARVKSCVRTRTEFVVGVEFEPGERA
jgi:hypothetical protein